MRKKIKKIVVFKVKLLVVLSFILGLTVYPLMGPRTINALFRSLVATQVFKIYSNIDPVTHAATLGSGSIINVPDSNKSYLITNRHVCESSLNGSVKVEQGSFSRYVKIIVMSKKTDLCAIETIKGFVGLTLANGYSSGDEVMVVGHPSGYPTTKTSGEIIGYEQVMIREKITSELQEKNCLTKENATIKEMPDDDDNGESDSKGFERYIFAQSAVYDKVKTVKYCITVEPKAILATPQIMPGSSGSPLLTWYGTVVGIAFATSSSDSWTRAVSLENLKEFLKELP